MFEEATEYLPKPYAQWSFDLSIPRPLFDKDKGDLNVSNLTEQTLIDFLWTKEITERIRIFSTPDSTNRHFFQEGFVESQLLFDKDSFMYESDLYALYVNFCYPKNTRTKEELSVDLISHLNFFRIHFANSLQTQIKENQVSFVQEGRKLKILGLKSGVSYVENNCVRF